MKTGDTVTIECDGRTVPGMVILASPNGKSLALSFDAILDGCVGMMPVLMNDDGTYACLMTGNPVKIR